MLNNSNIADKIQTIIVAINPKIKVTNIIPIGIHIGLSNTNTKTINQVLIVLSLMVYILNHTVH